VGGNPVTITATTVLLNTTLYWVDGAPYVASPTGGVELVSFALPDLGVTEPTNSYPAAFAAFSPTVTNTTPHADAPQIAEWTRQNDPGDTMALTAENLDEDFAHFVYYSEATTAAGSVQLVDGRQAAVTLPSTLTADDFYLMWAMNTNGFGEAVGINQTEAWWVGPGLVEKGETFSVFGRNMDLGDGLCQLYIDGYGWITNTGTSNPYKVDFVVPPDLANGTYTAYAHNGHGGKYGWANSVSIDVVDVMYWTGGTQTVATVSEAGLLAAIAASSNHDTVIIPAGTYSITSDIELRGHDGIWLKGAGAGQTIFTVDSGYVGARGESCILDCGSKYAGSETYFSVDNVKISGITFEWGDGTPEPSIGVSISGSRIWIEDCNFSQTNTVSQLDCGSSLASFHGMDGGPIFINNCTFMDGKKSQLGNNIFMDGCVFRELHDGGSDTSGYALTAPGQRISITDTTCADFDNSDYTDGFGWGGGRFTTGIKRFFYLGGSSVINYAPRYNFDIGAYDEAQPHQNAGEQVLSEHLLTEFSGVVSAVTTSNAVALTGLTTNNFVFTDYAVAITGGRGLGQCNIIRTHTDNTISFLNDWSVDPDITSVLSIGVYLYGVVIYDNDFSGQSYSWDGSKSRSNASVPVNIYGGALNTVIDGNRASDFRSGYSMYSILLHLYDGGVDSYAAPLYFNTIQHNTLTNSQRTFTSLEVLDSHGAPYVSSIAMLGTVIKGNYGTNLLEYAFSFQTQTGFPIETTIFNSNTFKGLVDGFDMEDGLYAIATDNISTGTGTAVTGVATLQNNTWAGFTSNYSTNYSQFNVPVHVFNTSTNAQTVTVQNSGTASINYTSSLGDSGTIAAEGSDTFTFTSTNATTFEVRVSGVATQTVHVVEGS